MAPLRLTLAFSSRSTVHGQRFFRFDRRDATGRAAADHQDVRFEIWLEVFHRLRPVEVRKRVKLEWSSRELAICGSFTMLAVRGRFAELQFRIGAPSRRAVVTGLRRASRARLGLARQVHKRQSECGLRLSRAGGGEIEFGQANRSDSILCT